MKGIVLAGGKGSRLRPFTYSGAKQLVPIANTPVLHFPVRQLVDCGITEIALVVGDTETQIRDAMGDGSAFGARFTYMRQEAPLGIAHALGLCEGFAGGEPVILYLGDNVLQGGIEAFVRGFAQSDAGGAVVLKAVEDPRAFGVAVVKDGALQRVVEKPAEPPSNLAVIGVYAFRPAVFDVIAGLMPSARGELEVADALNGLIERGHGVSVTTTAAYWIDTGKMEDMLAANRAVLDEMEGSCQRGATVANSALSGTVRIAPGAIVRDCTIAGPVVIGEGATLTRCEVGPHVSVGANCTLADSAVRNSIIMESSVVEDSPGIEDSMIGRFVQVRRAPAGSRLVLGDHSRFEAGQ